MKTITTTFPSYCKTLSMVTATAAALLLLTGCHSAASTPTSQQSAVLTMDDVPAQTTSAVATVGPSKSATTQPTNNNVTGNVIFTMTGEHMMFVADIDGLEPDTRHGFHIHEKGDLSDPDLKSAGGHFNPTKEKHGGPATTHHHAGDLGNLIADAKGHAHLEGMIMHVSLGGENSILDRSVIIHAKPDDLQSQPAGDSGPRIAGGVIKAAAK